MEGIEYRPIERGDEVALLWLIKELAVFEREPEAVIISEVDLTECLFEKKICYGWVAILHSECVGMAICYTRFSTWKGECSFLEDLVVAQEHRGKGIGKALLERVIAYARENKQAYAMWQVLDWNRDAIEFYKKMGDEFETERLNVKYYI